MKMNSRKKRKKTKLTMHADDSCNFSGKMHLGFILKKKKQDYERMHLHPSQHQMWALIFKGEHSFSPNFSLLRSPDYKYYL